MFIGNTFIKSEDVQSDYSKIDSYDMSDEDNQDIKCDIVLKKDFDARISQIESDVNSIITTLEKYNLSEAMDELKILSQKLY